MTSKGLRRNDRIQSSGRSNQYLAHAGESEGQTIVHLFQNLVNRFCAGKKERRPKI